MLYQTSTCLSKWTTNFRLLSDKTLACRSLNFTMIWKLGWFRSRLYLKSFGRRKFPKFQRPQYTALKDESWAEADKFCMDLFIDRRYIGGSDCTSIFCEYITVRSETIMRRKFYCTFIVFGEKKCGIWIVIQRTRKQAYMRKENST